MVRHKIKGTGCRKPSNPETEPNFWAMPPLHALLQHSRTSHIPAITRPFPPETGVTFRLRPSLLDAISLLSHGPATTGRASAASALPVNVAGIAVSEPLLAGTVPAPSVGLRALGQVAAAIGYQPAPPPYAFLDVEREERRRAATELVDARSLALQAQLAHRQHVSALQQQQQLQNDHHQQQQQQQQQQQRLLELMELQCTFPTVWATLEAHLAANPGMGSALFRSEGGQPGSQGDASPSHVERKE